MPSIQFKGKSIVHSYHLTVPYRQLMPDETRSVLAPEQPASLKGNLILHGDNLHALKSLIPSFAGKIKCIYIDPPYNTGNENWVYNDNVAHPMLQEWLKQVVDKEDLTRHDKWLCMMMPRLKLLRELLRDDGVIFISIDDNEAHRLRMLMDEIFGEDNFVANIVWQKKQSPQNDATYLSDMHDHILVYAKQAKENKYDPLGWTRQLLQRTAQQEARFLNLDDDSRGDWISVDYTSNKTAEQRPNLYYPIINPNTKEEIWPAKTRVWQFEKTTHAKHKKENRIWWGSDGTGFPRLKKFRSEVQEGIVPPTWWERKDAGDNQEAKRELRALFAHSEEEDFDFETPKPHRLVKRILQISTTASDDDIILDSFAGSGTTAHAVLALNAEDGGNRRFILVEQEDYADTLTAERVRRVIRGVPGAKDKALQTGLGGSFTYCTLGPNFDEDELLRGSLPAYQEMARFVFFTATGEQLDEAQIDEANCYLGESARYSVYLIYKPDIEYLKQTPLDLNFAMNLPVSQGKQRLIIASHKYLDENRMAEYDIEFCQLPFGIYRYRAD